MLLNLVSTKRGAVQNWHTGIFEPNPAWYYNYETSHPFYNALFTFDVTVYVKSIMITVGARWVGYFVDPELYGMIETELENHASNMGSYAGINTEVIVGEWSTSKELKADLKYNYYHSMIGAVLVGNMPMEILWGSIYNLYYEDMGGGPGPEIFIGHLRPPTSQDDKAGMAVALKDYFVRATNFINGGWTSPNKALLIQSRDSDLDSTNLKNWLDETYDSYDFLYSPNAEKVLDDYITNPEMSYDFCIMQAHSWYDNIVVYGEYNPPEGVRTTIYSNDIIGNSLNTPFYYFTCCQTTAFVDGDGNDNVDEDGNYYIAGQFAFNSEGWGLGAFGYSSSAGGETPGAEGFFETLNQGKTIGESIIVWGECWELDPSNKEHQNLIFIGDPLLKMG